MAYMEYLIIRRKKNSIRIFCGDVWNNHFINVLQNKKISKKNCCRR